MFYSKFQTSKALPNLCLLTGESVQSSDLQNKMLKDKNLCEILHGFHIFLSSCCLDQVMESISSIFSETYNLLHYTTCCIINTLGIMNDTCRYLIYIASTSWSIRESMPINLSISPDNKTYKNMFDLDYYDDLDLVVDECLFQNRWP